MPINFPPLPFEISQADQGGLWVPTHRYPVGNTNGVLGSANAVRVLQVYLPRVVFGKANIYVSTLSASNFMDVGFYDLAGNLLVHTAGLSTAAIAAVQGALTGPAVVGGLWTPDPGWYLYAFTVSDTVAGGMLLTSTTAAVSILTKNTVKKQGVGANAATAGILPTALGAITGTNQNILVSFFER